MKIQIVPSDEGGWFFRIVSRNGKTLCHSEIYTQKHNCRKTARLIRDGMWGVRNKRINIEEVKCN